MLWFNDTVSSFIIIITAMCMYEGKAITRCGGVIISISKGKGGIWFLVLLEEG